VFADIDKLPVSEGLQTTCYEIKKTENLIYLYGKYYNLFEQPLVQENGEITDEMEEIPVNIPKELPMRLPRSSSRFPLNAILYGAPGTGKTYATTEYAMAVIDDVAISETAASPEERKVLITKYKERIKSGQIVFTTFHQSYGYEDFIVGLRPVSNSTVLKFANVDGVFKRIADKAMHDNENNYVIIIDEINRGNISKVFGELITLIESDKRWGEDNELSATLPSGEMFAIPNNLYIVGTMNSADKSISLIDTALRRRFDFIETSPNAELVQDGTLRQILKKLNDELLSELDSTDLLIGHAYFINKSEADLVGIMNRNIIPLLYEYFFDNSRKVKAVVSKSIENLPYSIEEEKVGRIRITKKD
jgi:5-methylcytosine-specific restriction endonuclease McrBC GTP-binding regulatory subunit McrB